MPPQDAKLKILHPYVYQKTGGAHCPVKFNLIILFTTKLNQRHRMWGAPANKWFSASFALKSDCW